MNAKKIAMLVFTALSLFGCGNNANIFKFAHKTGSSSDTASLLNDAGVALQEKNYSDAMKFYSQILAKDPNNSQALYGYSAARLNSVLPISEILSRAIKDNSAVSRPVLSNAMKLAVVVQGTVDSLLPETLDYNAIYSATRDVITNLRKIALGQADGDISADDIDVLINLSMCLVIHEAINVVDTDGDGNINNDTNDAITIKEDYSISLNNVVITTAAVKADLKARLGALHNAIQNEVLGYLDKIINKIKSETGSTLRDLKTDITVDLTTAINNAKTEIDAI